ncbi:TonB-dependent receptor [Salisaeta longa]|uniref:TonB-dependent receptor n=1 Tax=Salisaeta longa TaxID=503170 RepID=UPI0003B3150E|nr:TonB-dependent receptor [Salisaeta longa]
MGWLLVGVLALPLPAHAQDAGVLQGVVTDQDTQEPLPGANVVLDGTQRGASTDADGEYRIDGLPAGTYTVRVTFVGYEPATRTVDIAAGETETLDLVLAPRTFVGQEIVVTGSKRPEKLLEAPVTMEAISAEELNVSGGGTYLSALSTLKGVDFVNVGINGQGISARGFNNHFNTRMLQMKDGRIAQLPGTGLPQGNFLPTSGLDLKTIEVVVGPAAALYGPNAHTGVVNVITKTPWDQSGLALDVRAGQNDLVDVNGRVAGIISEDFGWKVTGQYMTATDYRPPVGGPNATMADSTHYFGTSFHESALVENYEIESIRTEASLYYRLGDDWEINGVYGFSQNDNFGLTNNGRNRIKGWQVQYQSLQLSSESWFAQATHTSNDAGNTYQINGVATSATAVMLQAMANGASPSEARQQAINQLPALREANRFVDNGELWDSELQYRTTFSVGGGSLDLVTGGQYRYYAPDSDGTFLADAIGRDIDATEIGGYLQLDYRPTDRLRINLAGRVDTHSEYTTQFSPKAALVYTVAKNHNLRATYNRAFKSPTVLEGNLFIPIPVPSVAPGYVVNALGNYTGYVIQDPSGTVINRIDPLAPEEVNAVELGYKGVFGKRLFVDAVLYNSWYKNFISPLTTVANGITQIPFYPDGQPVDAPGNNQFNALSTYLNFGEAVVQGADLGVNLFLGNHFNVNVNGSYIYLRSFEESESGQRLLLNVPNTKLKGTMTMRDVGLKNSFLSLSGRWHSAYEFRSGYWDSARFYADGEVPSRFTAGLTAGYALPDYGVDLKLSVTNLFNNKRPDVLGAPVTERLIWLSATYSFKGLRF